MKSGKMPDKDELNYISEEAQKAFQEYKMKHFKNYKLVENEVFFCKCCLINGFESQFVFDGKDKYCLSCFNFKQERDITSSQLTIKGFLDRTSDTTTIKFGNYCQECLYERSDKNHTSHLKFTSEIMEIVERLESEIETCNKEDLLRNDIELLVKFAKKHLNQ